MEGLKNAILAGCCAGLTSVFGKYMGMSDLHIALRALAVIMLILFTMFMIGFMTKSMQSLSSLSAVIVNMSSNLTITALCSYFLFHEELSRNWLIGTTFMVLGVGLILQAEPSSQPKQKAS